MAPILLQELRVRASADGLAEVSVAHLAGTLGGLSDRHIQRLLRLLEAAGDIFAVRKAGGRGRPAQYRVRTSSDVTLSSSPEKGDLNVTLSEDVTLFDGQKGDLNVTLSGSDVTLSGLKGDTDAEGQVSPFPPPPFPPRPPYTPTPPTTTPTTRRLPPHARAAEVYRAVGAEPPAPGLLNHWAKRLGGMDPLCALLDELAGAGHLTTKGPEYVFAAVKHRVSGVGKPLAPAVPARSVADRRRLDQAAALAGRRGGAA